MNINKFLWLVGLTLTSAFITTLLTRIVAQFPEVLSAYLISLGMGIWFFRGQLNRRFRQALADLFNLEEGEYVIILFCICSGALIGGGSTWINILKAL